MPLRSTLVHTMRVAVVGPDQIPNLYVVWEPSPAILQPGRGLNSVCRSRGRTHGHRVGSILPAPVRARWQGQAVTATARKIAVPFYNNLRHGMAYGDPGASPCEEHYRRRVIINLQRRA